MGTLNNNKKWQIVNGLFHSFIYAHHLRFTLVAIILFLLLLFFISFPSLVFIRLAGLGTISLLLLFKGGSGYIYIYYKQKAKTKTARKTPPPPFLFGDERNRCYLWKCPFSRYHRGSHREVEGVLQYQGMGLGRVTRGERRTGSSGGGRLCS